MPYPRAPRVTLQTASQHSFSCEHCFRIFESVTLWAPANESCLRTEQRTSTPHECRPRSGFEDSWVWDFLDMNRTIVIYSGIRFRAEDHLSNIEFFSIPCSFGGNPKATRLTLHSRQLRSGCLRRRALNPQILKPLNRKLAQNPLNPQNSLNPRNPPEPPEPPEP